MSNENLSNEAQKHPLRKTAVISRFSLWWIRTFKVISNQRAKEIGLKWYRNVFGDEINHLNCRSIWIDKKGRKYRVSYLEGVSENGL
jgi:hypothetical protein